MNEENSFKKSPFIEFAINNVRRVEYYVILEDEPTPFFHYFINDLRKMCNTSHFSKIKL